MKKKIYSRKEFLGFFRYSKSSERNNDSINNEKLSSDKQEFLEKYALWLKDFGNFVESRNPDTFDIEQNKKIMELASKIEKEKETLENYMQDPIFANEFNLLTKEISSSI